jgi:adenylylsulfate kinase-like enzyme
MSLIRLSRKAESAIFKVTHEFRWMVDGSEVSLLDGPRVRSTLKKDFGLRRAARK